VKIDGYFIRGMTESQRKRLFVTTIANLAHVLGIRVIAEGVETESDGILGDRRQLNPKPNGRRAARRGAHLPGSACRTIQAPP
jgi:EAL domain